VCTQPGRHGVRGALGQQIDRPLLFQIHQNRAIDPPLAEGKIIDPEHTRGRLGGRWGAAENPEDRITAQWHPQAGGHPGASFPASLAPEDADRLGHPCSALRVAGGEGRQAFRKGLARTGGDGTAETPNLQAEVYGMLCDGEVPQAACLAAMHPC
jgi:hypothetical protein